MSNSPVVPTYFESGMVGDLFLEKGWYPVRINEKGIEYLTGTEINFKEDFEKCKLACDLHNQTSCKMSIEEIAILYVQRRFN